MELGQKKKVYGEGTKNNVGFPDQPSWFKDARGFKNIESGLKKIGFNFIRVYLECVHLLLIT